MNTYCLSCKKDTKNINPKVIKTKNTFFREDLVGLIV